MLRARLLKKYIQPIPADRERLLERGVEIGAGLEHPCSQDRSDAVDVMV